MAAKAVEWVLVIYYGPAAHQATYGRIVDQKGYTKDFIQLYRTREFLNTLSAVFPSAEGQEGILPIIYKWPTGEAPGALVFRSADRPHLKWETRLGAPPAWKMSSSPTDATAETIPGNPMHTDLGDAEREWATLRRRGAGQPYLIAVKLYDDPAALHLRAYLSRPKSDYAWADLRIAPTPIQQLAAKTRQTRALAWATFANGDEGLLFDPTRNHDAWMPRTTFAQKLTGQIEDKIGTPNAHLLAMPHGDAAAEDADSDAREVEAFREQIQKRDYSVPDSTVKMKTRGSAQRAFANAVKSNFGNQCAITGIKTRDFLVASHIVPWSEDQSIRLDPSNGICLSVLMDRAFEKGHLLIEDDLSIRIDWTKVGTDAVLRTHLEQYDGEKLKRPTTAALKPEYLRRRRALFERGG